MARSVARTRVWCAPGNETMKSSRLRGLLASAALSVACGGTAPAPAPPVSEPVVATTPAPPAPASAKVAAVPTPRADAALLPRKLLFDNPDRNQPRVSPDGKQLAW